MYIGADLEVVRAEGIVVLIELKWWLNLNLHAFSQCTHTVAMDDFGNSYLHFACYGGHMKVILYLIEEVKCDVGEYINP